MRVVAFLRGMNLGGRRITNDELRTHFEDAGFEGVATFMASGNVVFDRSGELAEAEAAVEAHLADALGYAVDTYVRPLDGLAKLVARPEADPAGGDFKVHVIFLKGAVDDEAAAALASLEGPDDRFRPVGREVLWHRRGGLSDAPIQQRDLERALGPEQTMRTLNTVRRIVAKFGA